MKPKIFLPTLLWLLSLAIVADAQESAQSEGTHCYARPVEHPSVYSPQTTAMMRYDNPGVNLNTGTVSLTIPLLEFNDPDFDVDLSMTYSMDGFKPLVPDNYVGMGWHLNCGGVITREVHGIPDEFTKIITDGGFVGCYEISDLKGFRMGTPADATFMDKVVNPSNLNGEFRQAYIEAGTRKIVVREGGNTEMSPDLYRFSFGEHSGQFMYNLDGTLKVVSDNGGHYEVDIQGNGICITTDNGYKYLFGYDFSALEYTALSWKDFSDGHASSSIYIMSNNLHKREITAYYLTKVIAPNGRILNYSYVAMPSYVLKDSPVKMFDGSFYNTAISLKEHQRNYQVIPSIKGEHSVSMLENCSISYTVNKVALISSISIDDKSVEFTYDNHSTPYFCLSRHHNCPEYRFVSDCGAKLTSLIARNGISGFEESVNLSYREDHGRLLLKSLQNSKTGTFNFEYFPSKTFDKSLTIDIDKWGFWSGAGANTSIKQITDLDRFNQIDEISGYYYRDPDDTNREPTGKEYDIYMLQKVTYPTGGFISYEYEPHTYTRYIHQPYEHYEPVIDSTSTRIAGGARIRRTIADDLLSPLKHVKYYQYDRNDGKSSGFLRVEGENYLRPYPFSLTKRDKSETFIHHLYSESPNILRQASLGGYISYGSVKEYDYDTANVESHDENLPHKVTEFIEPYITPQQTKAFDSDVITHDFIGCIPYSGEYGFLYEYYAYRGDYSKIFGKKLSESFYTHNQKIQRRVDYEYACINKDFGYFIHGYPFAKGSAVGGYSHVAKVPFFQHLLTKVTTTEYDAEDRTSIRTIFNYYDDLGYLISATETDSGGRTIRKTYEYPRFLREIIYAKMRALNMVSPVISETVTSDSEVIYKRRNDYKMMNINNPSAPPDTLLDIAAGSMPVPAAIYDTYGDEEMHKRIEYLSYDRYGNPLWIRSDGRDYVYVWGRWGRDLLAIVENATEPEVSSVLDIDYLNVISCMAEPSPEIGSTLRSALPEAMVTSYTHIPGVGVSSRTLPDGQTIYYEYDAKGRLSYTYRKDGETISIIEKYDYNLVNE